MNPETEQLRQAYLAEIDEKIAAQRAVLEAVRIYTDAREGCPTDGWQDRVEEAGWQVAQTYRQYRKLL